MNRLITVYWRDIPAQVIARKGRKSTYKKVLAPRFQEAIDRAAMRAGRGSSDDYLADWRRVSEPCSEPLEEAADRQVARLESEFSPERLEKVVRAAGRVAEVPG